MRPKEVLDRLKWAEGRLGEASVTIVHRGAVGDLKKIRGSDILSTDRSFMYVRSGSETVAIPYHRIVRIEVGERCVWERKR